MRLQTARPAIALGASLLALVLAAPPVAAFEWLGAIGTTGLEPTIDESFQPGIACRFEDNPGQLDDELDRIEVRTVYVHGPYAQASLVGFRFAVARNSPPFDDNDFVRVFVSPVVKMPASQTEVASFSGAWDVPEDTDSLYRVGLILSYYAPRSARLILRFRAGRFESYGHLHPTDGTYLVGSPGNPGHCREEYH